MKFSIRLIFIITSVFSITLVNAQTSCKVLKPEIAESYTGKCKKGLAHGEGSAEGVDKYEGKFKKGLPHGMGKYTWANGNVYEGGFIEGMKSGKGKLTRAINDADSVMVGFWNNDKFDRLYYEIPYEIHRDFNLTSVRARRIGSEDKVIFYVTQARAMTGNFYNTQIDHTSGTLYATGNKFGIENLKYPLMLQISFTIPSLTGDTQFDIHFEIEIFEPGTWEIILDT